MTTTRTSTKRAPKADDAAAAAAQAEIDRRIANKRPRAKYQAPKNLAASRMSGSELAAIAGTVQAPAPKRPTATQVRKAAAPKATTRKAADPVKALRAEVATLLEPAKGTGAWWTAYRATKDLTAAQLVELLGETVSA